MSSTKRYRTSFFSIRSYAWFTCWTRDDLDLGNDAVLGAEIEHLLGFLDAADQRSAEGLATENQRGGGDRGGFRRYTQQNHGPFAAQQAQVLVVVVGGGDGVDDEVEVAGQPLEGGRLGCEAEVLGAELAGVGLLGGGGAEHGDLSPHGGGDFDGHVAQAAEAHHAHLVALLGLPVAQGGIGGDAGAKQGRGCGQVQLGADLQGEGLIHHHARGVAPIGGRHPVHLGAVVAEGGTFLAELLQLPLAAGAGAAAVHHAAHSRQIAHLEALHPGAHGGDTAHDLVARHHGIHGVAPLVPHLVDVGVADAAVGYLNLDILGADRPPLDLVGREGGGGRGCGVGFGGGHGDSLEAEASTVGTQALDRQQVLPGA